MVSLDLHIHQSVFVSFSEKQHKTQAKVKDNLNSANICCVIILNIVNMNIVKYTWLSSKIAHNVTKKLKMNERNLHFFGKTSFIFSRFICLLPFHSNSIQNKQYILMKVFWVIYNNQLSRSVSFQHSNVYLNYKSKVCKGIVRKQNSVFEKYAKYRKR